MLVGASIARHVIESTDTRASMKSIRLLPAIALITLAPLVQGRTPPQTTAPAPAGGSSTPFWTGIADATSFDRAMTAALVRRVQRTPAEAAPRFGSLSLMVA